MAGLFSGIGGFEVAFERAGFTSKLLCEIEPTAQAVLKAKFPNSELIDDVKKIDLLPKGTDILCAGFPCQDLSSVGLKEGMEGSRSSLITEVFRILKSNPVEWVVIENVPFMLRLKNGQAIRYITSQLNQLGYNWAYRIVDSASFVPQRRDRVYIVGSRTHDPRNVLLADDFGKSAFSYNDYTVQTRLPIGFYWTEGKYSMGIAKNATPPLKAGSTIGIPSPPAIAFQNGFVATPDIKDAERLQGFDADWTLPAENVARQSMRWRLVGNAVTVDAIEWIANRIKNPGKYNLISDSPLIDNLKWPSAAWCVDGIKGTSTASKWPVENRSGGLDTFLLYDMKKLSTKATKGFVSRANAGKLKTPTGFMDILETHRMNMEANTNGI